MIAMSDYKSTHHGSTTEEFLTIVIRSKYFVDISSKSSRERINFADFGSGIGNAGKVVHDQKHRGLVFWGIENDEALSDYSKERLGKLNNKNLNVVKADFTNLPRHVMDTFENGGRLFIYLNNDRYRMADSTTNNIGDTTETRLVRSLRNYRVGTVLLSLGVLPMDSDWDLQRFCIMTSDIDPLTYAPNRTTMDVYRYEKVVPGVIKHSSGRSVIRLDSKGERIV